MPLKIKSLRTNIFPLFHSSLFALLFWLVVSGPRRNPTLVFWWVVAGAAIGLFVGVLLPWILRRKLVKPQKFLLSGILLVEFTLGVLLISPWIWLSLYFTPPSNLHSVCCETPKDYGAAQYETISINTADGGKIAGWYVAPTRQTGKAIILIHGYGYDRRGTEFQTRILIAAGYGVLLYDLRSHVESTGPINVFNLMDTFQQDLQKVIGVLHAKPGIEQIGIVGISLGSFATLNLPASQLNQFAGLWLDGLRFENFGSPQPIKTPLDYIDRIVENQSRWLAGIIYNQSITPPTLPFTSIIPTITHPPVMLVASGKDTSERHTNEQFIPLLGSNKELWIIENAWHIGGRLDAPEEYKARLLAFFEKAFSQANLAQH